MPSQRRRLLKFLKGARIESEGGKSRSKRALNRSEVARLLAVWEEDARPLGPCVITPCSG